TQDCRLVLLASGDRGLEEAFRGLAARAPGRIYYQNKVDERLSHLIEAGSDFFLMPSRFEPCGLNQMYSQAYGTVPVASRVGGLVDTVLDLDEHPGAATGILCEPSVAGLKEALRRSLELFGDPARYAAVQRRGMIRDFSWKRSVASYERLYRDAL
ncbi:MAG: glycogen synthase, partial [Opitutaceae bacterium]